MERTGCVVVFTKPATPGRVKTRLIGALTPEQAAELHQAFLDDVTGRLARTEHELWIAWALEPGEDAPPAPWPALRQVGETLGDRLHHALGQAAERFDRVAAVGSDHPEMPVERVDEAFDQLDDGADVVIGPASDGGYYLIALRAASLTAELFRGVPWSTSEVLSTTLERASTLGLQVRLLPTGDDVDTAEDLDRLVDHLAEDPKSCPRTRETLRSWRFGAGR